MTFVLDASATLAFMFPEERDEAARAVAEGVRSGGATAPAIWAWEVQNAIVTSERRGRIDAPEAAKILARAAFLPVRLEPGSTFGDEAAFARRYKLTVYNAVYLELAFRLGLPLATRDTALRSAADDLGIGAF
jgi:predicted nucleic acid-binding protein